MLVALICDTHWGVRNDSPVMLDYLAKSASWFISELNDMGITECIHLGDLVDRRKYINFVTSNRLRTDFLDRLELNKINTHIIAGNHDEYYKNTNTINALNELVDGKYSFIKTYTEANTISFDGIDILLLPWLCDSNIDNSMKVIQSTKANIVMGHLELKGFEMYRGSVNDHGMDHNIFNKFDIVCSGHFHHRSTKGNIHYLGAFGEYTWSDYGDPRGFSILDTNTREIQYIDNPYKMHIKLWYNDLNKQIDEIMSELDKVRANKFKKPNIKVIVSNKTNPYWFDLFIGQLEQLSPAEIQVVDDHLNLDLEQDNTIISDVEDTITIFKNYIDNLNSKFSKPKLNDIVKQLYNEAMQIE